MSRAPYKVIVWGPGLVGNGCIREVLDKPELELVGVLCYSPEKDGKDVGEILGIPPTGVRMTTDKKAIIDMDADVVLHAPRTVSGVGIDDEGTSEVCRLLESGKHVISSIAYYYPAQFGQTLVDKLENACQQGGACLHSTGVNPGVLLERIVVGFTVNCTRINHILVREACDVADLGSADMMRRIGFGLTPEEGKEQIDDQAWLCAYSEAINHALAIMGVTAERIDVERDDYLAEKDYDLPACTVRKGTIGAYNRRFVAVVDGRPFLTLEEIWYVDNELCPIPVTSEDYYEIMIDGEPTSVSCRYDVVAELDGLKRFKGDDRTLPAYWATIAPMIQAIPLVDQAEPGIVYPATLTNYTKDLRDFKVRVSR